MSRPDWYGLPTQAAWKAPAASTPSIAWTNEGMAQTVTGAIAPHCLGAVMMQEHLLVDLSGVNVPQSVAGPTGEHFWKLPCESLEVSGGLRFYSLVRRARRRCCCCLCSLSQAGTGWHCQSVSTRPPASC